jgi:hypothetical protein
MAGDHAQPTESGYGKIAIASGRTPLHGPRLFSDLSARFTHLECSIGRETVAHVAVCPADIAMRTFMVETRADGFAFLQ